MKRVLLVLMLMGCGSSEAEEPKVGSGHGQCARRENGSYVVRYTERDGNCGPIAEMVQNIKEQPTGYEEPCSGTISYTSDNCEVTYSGTCPTSNDFPGGTGKKEGHSKWSTDASHGEAVETLTIYDGDGKTVCLGTYDVTIDRQ